MFNIKVLTVNVLSFPLKNDKTLLKHDFTKKGSNNPLGWENHHNEEAGKYFSLHKKSC